MPEVKASLDESGHRCCLETGTVVEKAPKGGKKVPELILLSVVYVLERLEGQFQSYSQTFIFRLILRAICFKELKQ